MPLTDASADPDREPDRQRLFVYNGGFLTQKRIRRILDLSGWDVKLGKPGPGDWVGVWGQSPTSPRGEAVALATDSPMLRVEDAFLRSVLPGREGEPPLGLLLDRRGVHFDPSRPSDLEFLLATHPLDDTVLLNRARLAVEHLAQVKLSKYNAFDRAAPLPEPGYVLVIDQTRGDASVSASKGDRNRFLEMLFDAQEEHPGARVLIKSHPETALGHRDGYFRADDVNGRVRFVQGDPAPADLFEGAVGVYTLSSQLGFEAILAGHRPVVYGQPFYAGWGLTDDRMPLDRRQRRLTRAQMFAAAMILYPVWFDPFRDRLCEVEDVIDTLEARTRAFAEDRTGWIASGMRLWKRRPLRDVFGRVGGIRFVDPDTRAVAARDKARGAPRLMVWASKTTELLEQAGVTRIEDGFLRSRGLGADLVAPLSLVADDLGIYYDPSRESRLEQLIENSDTLSRSARARAQRLIETLRRTGVGKYNLPSAPAPTLPTGRRILVPGQVEDDASILLGAGDIRTNLQLLRATRAANPEAVIIYKAHPDVAAGLRPGVVETAADLADVVCGDGDPMALLKEVDEVWTMTSLLGFEALLRGVAVTCLGTPFYAGWGLSDDRGAPCPRRSARPDLPALVHAALIAYPRYFDPLSGSICPVEVVVERIAENSLPAAGRANRTLAKAQGVLATQSWIWRRSNP